MENPVGTWRRAGPSEVDAMPSSQGGPMATGFGSAEQLGVVEEPTWLVYGPFKVSDR